MKKVKVELTPYNGLEILSFMREFINDDIKHDPALTSIRAAVDEFEASLTKNITNDQITDAQAENQVNQLLGRSPER